MPIERRDFLKLMAFAMGIVALRSCERIGLVIPPPEGTTTNPTETVPPTEAPTQFVEPGRILNPEKDINLLTPEIKTRFEEFDSLYPELEGREVYKFAIQSPSGPIGFATYPLEEDEVEIAIIARDESGQTVISIPDRALYVTARDTQTGQYGWSRLLGIATPGETEDTKIVTWYYLPEGYPKPDEVTPLNLDFPILNYRMPQNGVIFFWEPAIDNGKSIWGSNPNAALVSSYDSLPEKAKKVLFSLLPVEPTPTPEAVDKLKPDFSLDLLGTVNEEGVSLNIPFTVGLMKDIRERSVEPIKSFYVNPERPDTPDKLAYYYLRMSWLNHKKNYPEHADISWENYLSEVQAGRGLIKLALADSSISSWDSPQNLSFSIKEIFPLDGITLIQADSLFGMKKLFGAYVVENNGRLIIVNHGVSAESYAEQVDKIARDVSFNADVLSTVYLILGVDVNQVLKSGYVGSVFNNLDPDFLDEYSNFQKDFDNFGSEFPSTSYFIIEQ